MKGTMFLKRLVSIGAAALMLASAAACGQTGGGSPSPTTAAAAPTSAPADDAQTNDTPATETPATDTPAAEDPAPETKHQVSILGQAGNNQFIKWEEREEYNLWTQLQAEFDKANLELSYETVPNEQYQVVIQTRMAAGTNLPDVVNLAGIETTTALTLGQQGVLQEINALIDQYSDGTIRASYDKYYPFADKLTTAPDGKKYWFSNLHYKHYNGSDPAPVGMGPLLRYDWLQKLGLETPSTKEEFHEALKAFRDQDVNGNGVADEVFVMGLSGFGNGIAQWFGLGVAATSVDVYNMEVVSPWYQEGIQEYFIYMQQLVADGLIDISALSNVGQVQEQRKAENRISGLSTYGIEGVNAGTTNAEGAGYIPLLPIEAVEGITPYALMEPNTLLWGMYGITRDCQDPEGAIRLFDVLHSDIAIELQSWGVKDEFYYEEDGVKYYKDRTTDEEYASQRRARGNQLWGDRVFPIIQEANLEYELVSVEPYKADYQLEVMYYPYWYSSSNAAYFAIPDEQQLERKNAIQNNINTFANELTVNLILGQASLDDWDSHIQSLKDLGLDELIQIDQALLERYNSL